MKKLFVTLLFAGFISFIPSSLHLPITFTLSAQIPSDGLVAWYPFNGNANDESGNGNDGMISGAALATNRFNEVNGSFSFYGQNDYIQIETNNGDFDSQNYTLSFWIKTNQSSSSLAGGPNINPGVISRLPQGGPLSNPPATIQPFCIYEIGGTLMLNTNNAGDSGTPSVLGNTWNHVIFSKSNGVVKSYFNGVLHGQGQNNGQFVFNNEPIRFGRSRHTYWKDFSGELDDIAFYNRALSETEVQEIFQDQTGQVQQPLTCNITTSTTTLCEGESITLSVNTTGGAGASSPLPTNLQQGLVAYYPFNGNANDESGNGNNGVVNGATLTADRHGNAGSAYSFDGVNDYIDVPHNSNFNVAEGASFTISTWVFTNSFYNEMCIVSKGQGGGMNSYDEFIFSIYENPKIGLELSNFPQAMWTTTDSSINYNNWELVSVVFDGTSNIARYYINGVFAGDYNYDFIVSADFDLNSFFIGKQGNVCDCNYFDGLIDDLVFYNRALTPSEIQQLYTAQSYAWSTTETTPTITVTPTQNTTYSCTVTQGNQTCTASVDITVNPNVSNAISATIIEGETYTLGTQTLTNAGTYTEVFTSAAGCDSTVTLTLAVEPLLTCEITAPTTTLCEGESVTLSVNTTGGPAASSQLPANLQQGLVAYYPFNGNANDESGNGNDGTVNGATLTSDRFGNSNSAYSFNGVNNVIDCGNISDINGVSKLTISLWMNISEFNDWARIIGKENSGNEIGINLKLEEVNSQFPNTVVSNIRTYNSLPTVNSAYTPNLNEWISVCFVFNGNNEQNQRVKYYFDSVNFPGFCDVDIPAVIASTDNPLWIGGVYPYISGAQTPQGYGFNFNGKIDDVLIYNRALSPSEIQQLYTIQSYAWSNNATTPTITVTPTQNTTYSCTITQGNQTCTDSITITVNPLLTWYADADADGFGNPNDVVQDCNQPQGYVSDNTDCNDEEATTYPGASEICDNNRDENCDGVDSLCFVAILGCTDVNACNFNPEANTEDNSCILPQPETCNGLDDNCNGQVDEGYSIPSINATSATPALYPTCTGNALKSANLLTGTDSPVIAGNGPDLWYSFTAQYNTLRVGLSAAFGDNSIGLYTVNNGCLELISEEHEVYTASTAATGNQILLTDQLTVGQIYYVAVHQITGPANASAKVCFTYLNESSCDHYYSNNTGVYTNVCNSFKAQYRANATNYIFNVLSGTQNGVSMNLTPWTYTNNNSNSVVARLGSIIPANHSGVNRVYTLSVPTVYGLTDAAGNVSNLVANATSTCTVTLNSEATIALRQADRCPTNKSLTSTIAPDRTVCGAMRYDWEFTQVLPNPGIVQVVQGGAYASVFFLSNVPGITAGKTYNVRVRPVHSSGITGNWGAVQCLRVGAAGMVQQSENESGSVENIESRVASISIYPNPTATGSFVLQYNDARRGELIFAQESMTELVMMDITGKIVFKTNVLMNGNIAEIHFGDLESGLYLIDFGGERTRVQVMK